ncbi:MAG: DUF4115 domain-containing protein [Alphaproteobacteria bacterium]|nr:DUF4115 domain-containing protein [Alphaproteobacteria bacterium]
MNTMAPEQEELYHTDMSVGEILRRTREHYNQSYQDIERALRIKAPQIIAIESDSVENLPGRVYAIGFVRSYSEYLGLDGDKMVKLFKAQSGGRTHKPHLDFPVIASESKMPPLWVVILSSVLAVFILIGWWSSQSGDGPRVSEIPSVPENLQVELGDISTDMTGDEAQTIDETLGDVMDAEVAADAGLKEEADSADTPAAAPAPAQEGILLTMLENSWVEIRDQAGKAIVSRVLKAGDQYYVPDRPDLSMSLGNAGGVKLQVDGQPLDFLGEKGQVRRNIALDAAKLKEQYPLKTIENTAQ